MIRTTVLSSGTHPATSSHELGRKGIPILATQPRNSRWQRLLWGAHLSMNTAGEGRVHVIDGKSSHSRYFDLASHSEVSRISVHIFRD